MSLKNVPRPDGVTNYCNKSFNLTYQRSPQSLENLLAKLDKTGPVLGQLPSAQFPSAQRKSRNFGSPKYPYMEGKLSTSVESGGLPFGAKSPASIYKTYPNIYRQGSALPRPYGPRDNLRMQSLYSIHGFGNKRGNKQSNKRSNKRGNKQAKLLKKLKKSRKRSRKLLKKLLKSRQRSKKRSRHFSSTPGTTKWVNEAKSRNEVSEYMNRYANAGKLAPAKGWTPKSNLYMLDYSSNVPNVIGMPNVPAQYTNNQLNSPVVFNFGPRKQKRRSRIRSGRDKAVRSGRDKATRSLARKKSARRRSFGPLIPNVAGPNTVGYQAPIPMYHAGANTIDFATNKLFRPNIIDSVGKVQGDGMTPNAWLAQSKGIGDGLGSKYRFGSLVYTPNGVTSGTGRNVIMQPPPPHLKFGGSVITLNNNGQIKISKAPV